MLSAAEAELQRARRKSESKERAAEKAEAKLEKLRAERAEAAQLYEQAKISLATAQTTTSVAEDAAAKDAADKAQRKAGAIDADAGAPPPAPQSVDGPARRRWDDDASAAAQLLKDTAAATFLSKEVYTAHKKQLDPATAALRSKAADEGLRIQKIFGDGHCQFRALARQLRRLGVNIEHDKLRADCVRWLRAHRSMSIGGTPLESFTHQNFDAYLRRMARSEWGDHLTLLAVGSMHAAKIRVISSLESWERPQDFEPLDPDVRWNKVLTIGHYHEYHWVSLEPMAKAPAPAVGAQPPGAGTDAVMAAAQKAATAPPQPSGILVPCSGDPQERIKALEAALMEQRALAQEVQEAQAKQVAAAAKAAALKAAKVAANEKNPPKKGSSKILKSVAKPLTSLADALGKVLEGLFD